MKDAEIPVLMTSICPTIADQEAICLKKDKEKSYDFIRRIKITMNVNKQAAYISTYKLKERGGSTLKETEVG